MINAARFLEGAHKLDWQPEAYRQKTGGAIPKILHHIFLDGEEEYDKCAPGSAPSEAAQRCHHGAHHQQRLWRWRVQNPGVLGALPTRSTQGLPALKMLSRERFYAPAGAWTDCTARMRIIECDWSCILRNASFAGVFSSGNCGLGCRAVEAARAVGSGFRREWRDSCIANHSDWKYMFWDRAAALAFLDMYYPWYTSTFLSYPKVVLQGQY
jgi:hypothetical protein